MQFVAMLMLQSAVAVVPSPVDEVVRLDPVLEDRTCAVDAGDDILVCGKRDDQRYRLPRLDTARFEPNRASKAELDLDGGMKAAAEVDSVKLPGGQLSNRLMVRLKLPF